ncbi:hypothetical protein V6N13_022826 [Hibiscus sabdariffa]|uniref:F-box domain-containing protein n=1 Tax=Hibiscus sabdariffa TaxID=183260 RepID=A0ABR2NN12_9ROSI
MGIFPDEVILQILARLPVKSLFKTKTVCKLWYKLVSDKYFVKLYNEVSSKNPMVLIDTSVSESKSKSSLICVDNLRGVSEVSLDFLKDRVKVRASCNGLLCCSSIPDKGVYYVCNPMTRVSKLLPRSRERPVTRFYPDGEATLVGLACDISKNKFNVVLAGYHRTFGHRPDGTFICLIFDSDSNKWRKFVSQRDDHFTHMNKNQVVFVNGALHWLTGSCSYILALDLDYDVWRKIPLPDEVSYGTGNRVYLLDSSGCLSLIQISDAWMKIWFPAFSPLLKPVNVFSWQHTSRSWYTIRGVECGRRCTLLRTMLPYHFGSRHTHFGAQSSLLIKNLVYAVVHVNYLLS